MEDYNRAMFAKAKEHPGDDFYSALNQAEIDGRPLTDEEKEGFAYLAFAGGRDTIIHTMTGIMAYFAKNPEDMAYLREHPEAINTAAEEFFRLAIPLTHIGRVCPAGAQVQGLTGGRMRGLEQARQALKLLPLIRDGFCSQKETSRDVQPG